MVVPREQSPIIERRRILRPAFTLLELAVVLFIMGLVMLIAIPYFGNLHRSQLKSEVRRLASRSNYLFEEAGAQKMLLRLTFSLDANGYIVTKLDPFAAKPQFQMESGPAGTPVRFPAGVRLRDVWVEGMGDVSRGTISTQFYPSGAADATVIHLMDASGDVYTLAINPYSGRTAIAVGDIKYNAVTFR